MTKLVKTWERLEEGYTVVGYEIVSDDTTVGAMTVMDSCTGAYVEGIVVEEQYRGHGIGTDALLQASSMYGGIAIAPDNERAARLYQRLGTESRYEGAEYVDQGFGVYDI